jgi:hypothetical protein
MIGHIMFMIAFHGFCIALFYTYQYWGRGLSRAVVP